MKEQRLDGLNKWSSALLSSLQMFSVMEEKDELAVLEEIQQELMAQGLYSRNKTILLFSIQTSHSR